MRRFVCVSSLCVLVAVLASCTAGTSSSRSSVATYRSDVASVARSGALRTDWTWEVDPTRAIGSGVAKGSSARADVTLEELGGTENPEMLLRQEADRLGFEGNACGIAAGVTGTITGASYSESQAFGSFSRKLTVTIRWEYRGPDGALVVTRSMETTMGGDDPFRDAVRLSFLEFLASDVPARLEPGEPLRISGDVSEVAETDFPSRLAAVQDGIVSIRTQRGSATATVISEDGFAITSFRAVSAGLMGARLASGEECEIALVCSDSRARVALLQIVDYEGPTVPLHVGDVPAPGSEVYTVAAPISARQTHGVSRAFVEAYLQVGEIVVARLGLDRSPGIEGGPVLDERGRLIGVTTVRGGSNAGFVGIPTEVALATLGIEVID